MKCLLIVTLALGLFVSACRKSERVVSIRDGDTLLNYECADFRSQVKSRDEIHALRKEATSVRVDAANANNPALSRSLKSAMDERDYLRLEQIVVDYKCGR